MSRGPLGGDWDHRGAGPPGRPGWNDRPTSQEKNPDDKDTKRSASRWAVNESSSPTVVSDEENWEDDDVIQPTAKKTETLAPLPQTEPIDDDSQEEDFNDFEDDAGSVELNKPVAIVEIGDDSSSSSVEELTNTDRVEDEAAATPLYDEPETKDKTPIERSHSQDVRVVNERDVEDESHSLMDDVGGNSHEEPAQSRPEDEQDEQDEQEVADEVSEDHEDHEQFNHSNKQYNNDVMSNGDGDETRSEGQSNDERTARPHANDGGDRDDEEEEEELRCPTPDAHIDYSENEETDSNAQQTEANVDDGDRKDDDDDAIQSD